MIIPFAAQTHGRWLSDSERRVLLALFAQTPRLTAGQIQLALQDKTGRLISTSQICRTRHKRFRVGVSDHPRRHLTEAERLVLNRICRHSQPTYHPETIARTFEAETGRKLARKTVDRFLETRLGLAPSVSRPAEKVVAR